MDPKIRALFGAGSFENFCSLARKVGVRTMEDLSRYQGELLSSANLSDVRGFPKDQLKKIILSGFVVESLELGGATPCEDNDPAFSYSYLSLLAPRDMLEDFRRLAENEEDFIKFYFMDAWTENEYRKKEKAKGGGIDQELRVSKIVAQDKANSYYNFAMLSFPSEPLEIFGEKFYENATANWIIIRARYHYLAPKLHYLVACIEGVLSKS